LIDFMPRHQLGYVLPVLVSDYIHNQFYRISPPSCHLVCTPLDLRSFDPNGVDEALKAFEPAVDFLINRGVDRISQGGIPISALAGRKRIQSLLDAISRKTSIPATADFEESILALQEMGVKKVAVAAKWDDALMKAVARYLKQAGIETVGTVAEAHTAAQVVAVTPQAGLDMALALGSKALKDFPEADGLLLAGGAWMVMPSVPVLEAEFGKPVVTNPTATYWAALRQFRLPAAEKGYGRLLDSLR
jgi:arylmalonate decarboxylase